MWCIKKHFLVNNINDFYVKEWDILKKIIGIIIGIILIISLGVFLGIKIFNNENKIQNLKLKENKSIEQENANNLTIEVSNRNEEKTTPNTLIIYKTYYAKCKHYVQEYNDIDASLVNLTKEELKEKCREWDVEKFSAEEIEMSKEVNLFCNQHYKIKLENNVIVIYNIDEFGIETEYEHTGITTEYLTNEDILKLSSGIYVYGKEELSSVIEDYE